MGGPVISDSDREVLGATFDRAAGLYQRARPNYPDALFDDLVAVAGAVLHVARRRDR